MSLDVDVLLGGEMTVVPTLVYFANHCWTKSRQNEPDTEVLFRERYRDGTLDERVFCPERYAFSLRLPGVVANLQNALCWPGNSEELFYRWVEEKPDAAPIGWYLCVRLGVNNKQRIVSLNVRSSHYRQNRPVDVRGGSRKFFAIFAEFYGKKRGAQNSRWLRNSERKKAP